MAEVVDRLSPEFSHFLEEFSKNHSGSFNEGDSLPYRIVPYYITEEELEGECIDLCMQYLALSKCPHVLAAYITRAAVDEFMTFDLNLCLAQYEGETIKLYQANSVARAVFSCVNVVCQKWTNSLPATCHHRTQLKVSVHAIKNTRRKMEDRHVVVPDMAGLFRIKDNPRLSYFAVFDGHGGLDASSYAAAHILFNLIQQKSFTSNLPSSLKQGYIQTDANFVIKSEREQLKSGSTGVSVVLSDESLHVAWLGDSQAVLVRDGQVVTLMDPHKPEREDEKKRIESLGGCVVFFGAWRVNGSLSVSRAIGDAEHKPYISGEPDVASFELTGTEDYLVLACDGLWDTVSPSDVVSIVYHHVQSESMDTVAEKLVRTAKNNGSNDNISVIVVFLRENISPPCLFDFKRTVAVDHENVDKELTNSKEPSEKEMESNINEDNQENCVSYDAISTEIMGPTSGGDCNGLEIKQNSSSGVEPAESVVMKQSKSKQDQLKKLSDKRKMRKNRKVANADEKVEKSAELSKADEQNAVPAIEINEVVPQGDESSNVAASLAQTFVDVAGQDLPEKKDSVRKTSSSGRDKKKPTPSAMKPLAPKQQTFGSELGSSNVGRTNSFPVTLKPKKSSLTKKNSSPVSFNNNSRPVNELSRNLKEKGSL